MEVGQVGHERLDSKIEDIDLPVKKITLVPSKERPQSGNIVIISRYGELTPLASRIGATLYFPNRWYRQRGLYSGICSIADTLQDALRAHPAAVIADHTGDDDEPLGKLADALRARKVPIWGAGEVNDLLENNRAFALLTALKWGLNVPQTLFFDPSRGQPWTMVNLGGKERIFRVKGHLAEAQAFVAAAGGKWVFKPCNSAPADLTFVAESDEQMERRIAHMREMGEINPDQPFIIQQFIKGVEISTEIPVSHGEIVGPPNGTFETKKTFQHDTGPNSGCQTSVCFVYDDMKAQLVHRTLGRPEVKEWLKKPIGPGGRAFPPYNSMLDLNMMISEEDHEAWYLEPTPRPGYSAVFANMILMGSDLRKIFIDLAHGKAPDFNYKRDQFGYAVRVQIPPAPYADQYVPPSGKTEQERKANWAFAERVMEDATHIHIGGPVDDPNIWLTDAQAYKGGIRTAGVDGAVMEITTRDADIEECAEKGENLFKQIDLPDAFARIGKDGVKRACEDGQTLARWGYPIPGLKFELDDNDKTDRPLPVPRPPIVATVVVGKESA